MNDDTARRVTVLHHVGRRVDDRTLSLDPAFTSLLPVSEKVRELTIALGNVAACEYPEDRPDALLELAALACAWAECELREMTA